MSCDYNQAQSCKDCFEENGFFCFRNGIVLRESVNACGIREMVDGRAKRYLEMADRCLASARDALEKGDCRASECLLDEAHGNMAIARELAYIAAEMERMPE